MNEKRVHAPLATPQHRTPCWYHIDRTRDRRPVQSDAIIPHVQPFRRPDRQDKPMPGHGGQTKFTAGGTLTVTHRLQCFPFHPVTRCRRGEWGKLLRCLISLENIFVLSIPRNKPFLPQNL